MGEVIRFPDEVSSRGGKYVDANTEPATVIILPVIRIDRDPDGSNGFEPDTGNSAGMSRGALIAGPLFCAAHAVSRRRDS